MRSAAYLGVAVLLLLVQSNLFRLLGPLSTLLGARLTHGATPSLLLPMVIFLGVYEPSMAKGAALSCAMGYAQDILATAPIGLFAFVHVAIWWLARVAGVRLTAQTWFTRRPVSMASVMLANAVTTALVSPALFQLAQRLRQGGLTRAQNEGAG